MEIPKDKNGEYVCIKCKKTPQDFIPICDKHDKCSDQMAVMNCEGCHTCDECEPRKYLEQSK